MSPLSIRNQFCKNDACAFKGKALAGNIRIHGQKRKRLQCSACKKTWSMDRNERWFGIRAGKEKFERTEILLKQQLSVRKIARLLNVSPGTIQRWKKYFHF